MDPSATATAPKQTSADTKRILVVDDELSVREILAEGLEVFGYETRMAAMPPKYGCACGSSSTERPPAPETTVEVFYLAQLTPYLTIQPDLQYIASPSGIYRDSIAAGLRFQLNL